MQFNDGVYTAVFSNLGGKLIHRLRVDANHGMSPVEFSHSESDIQYYQTESAWTTANGISVPSHCKMTDYQTNQMLQLELSWHNINEPLNTDIFKIDSFALPDGTLVVDHRLEGKPIIESVIGRDKQLPPTGTTGWTARTIAVILNVLVLLLIALMLLYRKFKPTP